MTIIQDHIVSSIENMINTSQDHTITTISKKMITIIQDHTTITKNMITISQDYITMIESMIPTQPDHTTMIESMIPARPDHTSIHLLHHTTTTTTPQKMTTTIVATTLPSPSVTTTVVGSIVTTLVVLLGISSGPASTDIHIDCPTLSLACHTRMEMGTAIMAWDTSTLVCCNTVY